MNNAKIRNQNLRKHSQNQPIRIKGHDVLDHSRKVFRARHEKICIYRTIRAYTSMVITTSNPKKRTSNDEQRELARFKVEVRASASKPKRAVAVNYIGTPAEVRTSAPAKIEERTGNSVERIPPFPFMQHQQDGKCQTVYEMSRNPQFLRNQSLLETARKADELSSINSTSSFSNKKIHNACGDSVIWMPKTREEWVDSLDEMTSLCQEAALRSAVLQGTRRLDPPLSREYIRDRIDIDDPLRGYQVRHKYGGWLQGFVLTTTFTTWTHYFKWDSKHPQSGMVASRRHRAWDYDGIMTRDLELQDRSGDPLGGGVIWHRVAEISLVGGLGCGEYCLRMALDDIEMLGTYDYVVLQATPSSQSFYQRFGFVRVGAVAKYSNSTRVVGYRHWTYANESNLDLHGGPSYMMAKKVNHRHRPDHDGVRAFSFMDALQGCFVNHKPLVMPQMLDNITIPCAFPYVQEMHKLRAKMAHSNDVARKEEAVKKLKENVVNGNLQKRMRSNDLYPTQEKVVNRVDQKGFLTPPLMLEDSQGIGVERLKCVVSPATIANESPNEHISDEDAVIVMKTSSDVDEPLPATEVDKAYLVPVLASEKPEDKRKDQAKCLFEMNTDGAPLRKQRVADVYQDPSIQRLFSKTVAKRNEPRSSSSYYFVVHFSGDESNFIHVIPLEPRGKFSGKREGRTKFRASMDTKIEEVPWEEYEVVNVDMVTKTPVIKNESWDIKERSAQSI